MLLSLNGWIATRMLGESHSGLASARRALLDALEALQPLGLENFVLVGAQAVYVHCSSPVANEAAFTGDADLVAIPQRLFARDIYERFIAQGFALRGAQPGLYSLDHGGEPASRVDVLVPNLYRSSWRDETFGQPYALATMSQEGLELTLTDNEIVEITAMNTATDERSYRVAVAGPLSLIIAKAFKIHDRLLLGDEGFEEAHKDILDTYRLLHVTPLDELRSALEGLWPEQTLRTIIVQGAKSLQEICTGAGAGITLLEEHLDDVDESRILVASLPHLIDDFASLLPG